MSKPWIRSIGMAMALALAAATAQAAEPLFAPLDSELSQRRAPSLDPSFQALVQDPAAASLQLVRARADVLNEKTSALTLNLAPGLDLHAQLVEAYRTESGNLVWSGIIADRADRADRGTAGAPLSADTLRFDPINTAMLVRSGDQITGNVHFEGVWYKIRPLRTGGHAIVEVDSRAFPPDHPPEFDRAPTTRMPETSPLIKADTVIRVMVHYTSAAANASGNISSLIDLAVAETNQGYTNSGVLIDVVLAHKGSISYTESGNFSTDLARYRSTSDGYMDSIHTTRNSVAADVGVLIINNASYCGLASGIGSSASTAFAAVYWDCATGYYSFGHEIGHLQSARHDPATDPTNSPYAYGHGYQYLGSPKWRTIMAYACTGGCTRLNYWSNPSRTYNGQPMGTTTRSDNTRVLNNTRTTVAGFR
jgi:peptidyl-Asp metalloendopeptidase